MAAPSKTPSAEESRRRVVKNLITSLYEPSAPLLDRNALSAGDFYEFFSREDVHNAAARFTQELYRIWVKQYPGAPFPLVQGHKADNAAEVVAPAPVAAPADFAESAPLPSQTDAAATATEPSMISPTPPESSVPPEQATTTAASSQPAMPAQRPGAIPPTTAQPARSPDPVATFQIANAKQGQPYLGKIVEMATAPRPMRFRQLSLPANLGLQFDAASGELSGTPQLAGEHEISLQWSADEVAWYQGRLLLVVNPDPRSLWKVNEPPADALYPKAHLDCKYLRSPQIQIVAASRRGRSHEHAGSFRDDDFYINHDAASGWSVLIVADGAGSAKHSRMGSQLAVQATGEHLIGCVQGEIGAKLSTALDNWDSDPEGKALGAEFHYLFHKAASLAVQAIETEAQTQGAAVKDYATTLLVAVVKRQGDDTFVATFWMGDGAIAAYGPRGTVRLMGTPDSGEFAGQTRFLDRAALADQGYGKRIKVGRFRHISAVLLMTDGVSDPRFETDKGLADAGKWDGLWDEIAPHLAADDAGASLCDWLHFFTPGHHDDRTIAVLW